MSIHEKALLVQVSRKMWNPYKKDAGATEEAIADNDAADNAGRFNKHLLKDSKPFKDVQAAFAEVYRFHTEQTLPYMDKGPRLLATNNYLIYGRGVQERITEAKQCFENVLVPVWQDECQKDSMRLGKMWSMSDYPAIHDLRDRFSVEVKYFPLPNESAFTNLVDLDATEIAAMQGQLKEELEVTLKQAMQDPWRRLMETVGKLSDRLAEFDAPNPEEKRRRLHSTLVDNIEDLVALMPALNLTGDPALAEITKDIEDKLCGYRIESVRDNMAVRTNVKTQADAIVAKMQGYMGIF